MRDVYPMRRVWESGSKDEGSSDATRRQPLQSNGPGCTEQHRAWGPGPLEAIILTRECSPAVRRLERIYFQGRRLGVAAGQ